MENNILGLKNHENESTRNKIIKKKIHEGIVMNYEFILPEKYSQFHIHNS